MGGNERKKLTTRQWGAVAALVRGLSYRAAAREAGVAEITIRRWMADPVFAAVVAAEQAAAIEAAGRLLSSAMVAAAHTAAAIMTDPHAPLNTRLAAARIILDSTLKVRGEIDLERRLTELENRL